jgi:hypothetical protein
MSKLRVNGFSLSLDGFGAGPEQSTDNPLGIGGEALNGCCTFQVKVIRKDRGATGPDDDFAAHGFENYRRLDHGAEHVRPD